MLPAGRRDAYRMGIQKINPSAETANIAVPRAAISKSKLEEHEKILSGFKNHQKSKPHCLK